MSKTHHQQPQPKLKPRQVKRQKLERLLKPEPPQPEPRVEVLPWKPMG